MTADHEISREEIIAANPIEAELARRGITLQKRGSDLVCCCPIHNENTPSFTVTPAKNVFYCFGCGVNGSVIDLVMELDGVSVGQAMESLSGANVAPKRAISISPSKSSTPTVKPKIVATYSYHDETGTEVYQALRLEPKSFRQRHMVESKWIWNMEGVRRVLYNLKKVAKATRVWIVEGEKDVHTLTELGFIATTNVGGAKKWMDGYSDALKGKEIVLCPDNDQIGKEHAEQVLESLAGKASAVRQIQIPSPHKDVSDFVATLTKEDAAIRLAALAESAVPIIGGIKLPVYSMKELEGRYREFTAQSKNVSLTLGSFLPSLGRAVRGLVPGELVTILADTGVGKTAIMQNIALCAAPLVVLLFEMELPDTLTFERFVQIARRKSGHEIQETYSRGGSMDFSQVDHVYTCPQSNLKPEDIDHIITKSELKIGKKPAVVMIDYIGLVSGKGNSRYEKMSNVAEQMKVLAKSTNTVIILGSQVHRKDEDGTGEIFLHDAKDSGSIENSSGLVLGAWRDATDSSKLNVKILKNTKGKPGLIVPCHFEGESLSIRETAQHGKPSWSL